MPIAAKKICNHIGCNAASHNKYCSRHKQDADKEKKYGWQDAHTTTQRGYGQSWRKIRKEILMRDNYLCKCGECTRLNRLLAATEVDHVVSKSNATRLGWSSVRVDSADNLQAINKECHKRKTAEERHGRG